MYNEEICARSRHEIERREGIKLKRYQKEACWDIAEHLESAHDGKKPTRNLTADEAAFIRNEQLMCSIDFLYWAYRYAKIKTKAPGPARNYVPWESQQLLHDLMSDLEASSERRHDGIMIANCKARQLGMSTVYEMAISHKAFFTHGLMAVLAADEPGQSEYLFNMMERLYDNTPWWLRPVRDYHVKGTQMYFRKLDSLIIVQYGSIKTDVGRGKTPHVVHLSEIEKWENPQQIDDGLMPALPRLPTTMAFFESTGEYRGSWWHSFFNDCLEGLTRFEPFFVPWYAEPMTYIKPAPDGWSPDEITAGHARQVERDSPRWMRGRTVKLNRDQLYFWEFTRREYLRKGNTGVFLCEYASSPQESFRSANSSVFSFETLDRLMTRSSFPNAYEVMGPKIDHDKLRMEQLATKRAKTRSIDTSGASDVR